MQLSYLYIFRSNFFFFFIFTSSSFYNVSIFLISAVQSLNVKILLQSEQYGLLVRKSCMLVSCVGVYQHDFNDGSSTKCKISKSFTQLTLKFSPNLHKNLILANATTIKSDGNKCKQRERISVSYSFRIKFLRRTYERRKKRKFNGLRFMKKKKKDSRCLFFSSRQFRQLYMFRKIFAHVGRQN